MRELNRIVYALSVTATQSFLEIESVRDRVHPLSVEDYHALGELGHINERVELLRGVVVEKMSKSPLHSFVCQRLADIFRAFASESSGWIVRQEQPLTFEDSEPEPDLSIISGRPEDFLRHHPTTARLVIEVAISSIEVDLQKAPIYAEADIPEFWLVRPADLQIDVFTRPENGIYQEQRTLVETNQLTCEIFPDFSQTVGELLGQPTET